MRTCGELPLRFDYSIVLADYACIALGSSVRIYYLEDSELLST
jgi:hypothetical protein